jgi:hypothetical protein
MQPLIMLLPGLLQLFLTGLRTVQAWVAGTELRPRQLLAGLWTRLAPCSQSSGMATCAFLALAACMQQVLLCSFAANGLVLGAASVMQEDTHRQQHCCTSADLCCTDSHWVSSHLLCAVVQQAAVWPAPAQCPTAWAAVAGLAGSPALHEPAVRCSCLPAAGRPAPAGDRQTQLQASILQRKSRQNAAACNHTVSRT